MKESVELINYSIYPNHETWLVSEMVDRNTPQTVDDIKQAVHANHEGILEQLAKKSLAQVNWDWLKTKHNM